MIRAVLFDAVGTLIIPRPHAVEVYHEVAKRYGSQSDVSGIGSRFKQAFCADALRDIEQGYVTSPAIELERWRQIVAATLDDVPDGAQDKLFAELWHHFSLPTSWQLNEDLIEVWQLIRSANVRIGIASNFDDRLENLCAGLPPLDQADAIFYSSKIGYRKPSPNFFAAIESALDLCPHELLMIGDDRQADYAGARQAGWHAFLVQSVR